MKHKRIDAMNKLLTAHEVAQMLSIKTGTVYNWVCQGKLPHVKLFGALRFRKEDIQRLIEQSLRKNDSNEEVEEKW